MEINQSIWIHFINFRIQCTKITITQFYVYVLIIIHNIYLSIESQKSLGMLPIEQLYTFV